MGYDQKNMTNLIICMTPLQTLIAIEIIKIFPKENFDIIYVSLSESPKDYHYYQLIKVLSRKSFFIKEPSSFLGIFNLRFFLDRLSYNYDKIFIANIERRFIHLILSRLRFKKIHTFDDGVGNIITSSVFYSNITINPLKCIVWRIAGIKYDKEDIKEVSQLHYTIYKNIPNIIENTRYIPLLPQEVQTDFLNENKIVKFYLGQPLTDIDEKFDHCFVESNIRKLKFDYYYPHPREKIYPKGDYEIVENSLIFEDYIVDFLRKNLNVKVEVYSFISTASLNVSSLLRAQCFYLYDNEFMGRYKDFYLFSKEKFNIKLKNVESI